VIGYTSIPRPKDGADGWELKLQADVIAGECKRRGLELLDLVSDREPPDGTATGRSGFAEACRRISTGEARGLVVSELARLTRSANELGTILESFTRSEARLVAAAEGLDTKDPEGRRTARALSEISGWERDRLRVRAPEGQPARLKRRPLERPPGAAGPGASRRRR
jgi:DNA invertase Pin-like site-specific DNA recombinase